MSGIVQSLIGSFASFSAVPDGLWSWGKNFRGQLGIGTLSFSQKTVPTQIDDLTTWDKLACSWLASFAIKTDGTLWSWGGVPYGTLGQGYTGDILSPTQVGALTNWSSISAGKYHCLAIKTNNTLWAWGKNNKYQLGFYSYGGNYYSPIQIGSLTNWASVTAAKYHSLAIKTDGTLWAWGYNDKGQLGVGNTVAQTSPVQVGSLTDWAIVKTGKYHTLAIKTNGTLWAWGKGTNGQLGNGSTYLDYSSPIQIGAGTNWSSIAVGRSFSHALKTDNTLWAWGNNYFGPFYPSSPIQVGSFTDWQSISAYEFHSMGLRSNGTIWGWGENNQYQLGLGDTTTRYSPTQIGTSTFWTKIATGNVHSLAIQIEP